jgi:phosphoribosylformylglycinamidine synthase
MSALIAVVVFPGSNCEHDVVEAIGVVGAGDSSSPVAGDRGSAHRGGDVGLRAELVWHGEHSLAGFDAVVLPGGFAHGDYLRPGAIARFSPIMDAVGKFAAEGGPVVGICNGFQVLTEAGLLPGALQKNRGLRFLCTAVEVTVCTTRTPISCALAPDAVLHLPINHFEGNYTCDAATLERLVAEDRVVLRYTANPNGSLHDIAAVCNVEGNVVGLMPHPERACSALTGSTDGIGVVRSLISAAAAHARIRA